MNNTLRRLGYALIVIIWLMVMSFPFFAVLLATQQELVLGDPERRQLRIFLVQEENADGIGIMWTRPASVAKGACTQSSLHYLMWRGDGEAARFCRCYDRNDDLINSTSGACTAP
jgi:hypothetical protein